MKFYQLALFSSVTASFLLPSCATKFSPAQRAALNTVAVSGTTVDPEAYEEPYGGDIEMRKNAANTPGFGILGPLVGMGVGGAIAGTQNANFKGKNRGYFAAVQKNTPTDLGKSLGNKLKQSLKNDSFFRTRIAETSSNLITSDITCFRLIRSGKNDAGELMLVPQIYATIYLKDAAGKTLAGRAYIVTGAPAMTAAEYASSPAKTRSCYDTAIDFAVKSFDAELALKTCE